MAKVKLHSRWRCIICGETVEDALVFALVKDSEVGITVGKCCYEKLREPGMIIDPKPIFLEVIEGSLEELAKKAGYSNLEEAYAEFEKEKREKEERDPTRLPKGWATLGNDNNKVH